VAKEMAMAKMKENIIVNNENNGGNGEMAAKMAAKYQ